MAEMNVFQLYVCKYYGSALLGSMTQRCEWPQQLRRQFEQSFLALSIFSDLSEQ
jgi:hypothetical protein